MRNDCIATQKQRWSFPFKPEGMGIGERVILFSENFEGMGMGMGMGMGNSKKLSRKRNFFFWNRYRVGEVVCVKKLRFFGCSSLSKISIFFSRK